VLENLDARGLRNHVLIITRHQMKPGDIDRLNALRHLKVTLLFTYSGIDNQRIEPYPSSVAADSLRLTSAPQAAEIPDDPVLASACPRAQRLRRASGPGLCPGLPR
jgi:hypothetical protein